MSIVSGPRGAPFSVSKRAAFNPIARPGLSADARRSVVVYGNHSTTGPFAPLVTVTRSVMGKKEFNQFRGKAISIHSQIIKEFCGTIGAGPKQAQAVIRLAKKNGEWLGFLA